MNISLYATTSCVSQWKMRLGGKIEMTGVNLPLHFACIECCKSHMDFASNTPKHIFPQNLTLDECREAINGCNGFHEYKKEDYIVFNYSYVFHGSFPDPKKASNPREARLLQIRRECRGLIFDERGKVLSRRFHKFFNVNELEETNENVIDLSRPHILTEKIDGSLFTPFYTKGRLRWGSKLGVTEMTSQVEDRFLPNCGIDYNTFSAEWLAKEWTPIFEWCSLENQVVIRYPVSQLVLIALRHHITGEYMKYSEMANAAKKYNIPVVPTSSLSDGVKSTGELLAKVKKLENMEGFVLMFENGEMYKMKCDWYVQIAGMSSAQEKDFFLLILEKRLDDMGGSFGKERREKLEDFGMKLMEVIEKNARRVNEIVADAKRRGLSKKEFAQEMKNLAAANKGKLECHTDIFFKVFEGKDAFQLIVDTLKKNCLTNAKLNKVRDSLAGGLSIKL